MPTRALPLLVLLTLMVLPATTHALGVDAWGGGDLERVDFDLAIVEHFVDARAEMTLKFAPGDSDELVVNFALPEGGVVYRAEYWDETSQSFHVAETMGRSQGENVFDAEQDPERPLLLVQEIGRDLYRARVRALDEERAPVRIRIAYAHPLEHRPDGARLLRVPLQDPISEQGRKVPLGEITTRLERGPWLGTWWLDDPELAVSPVDGARSIAERSLDEDLFIVVDTSEPIEASAIRHRAAREGAEDIVAASWRPPAFDDLDLEPAPRAIVFVLDISGSMSGVKEEQARAALERALDALSKRDRFAIVAFDDRTFSSGALEGVEGIERVQRWLDGIQGGRGTGLEGALREAGKLAKTAPEPFRTVEVMLLTDGNPTEGADSPGTLHRVLRGESERARIFGLGIGHDLSQDFLNDLTQRTGGEAVFALNDSRIEEQFLDFFERVRGGGLSDAVATLSVGEREHRRSLARLMSQEALVLGLTLDAGEEREMTLTLAGQAPDGSAASWSTEPIVSAEPTPLAAPLAARAWARDLERVIDQEGESAERVDEAVVLARTYGILTRYSSLVVAPNPSESIARDEAGIAIVPPSGSDVDESRIGGAGLDPSYADGGHEDSMAATCASASSSPSSLGVFALAILLLAGTRRRKRGG